MTIQEIENHPKPTLTPGMVGAFLGMNPDHIRYMARNDPSALGFPVTVYRGKGSANYQTRIPKDAFVRWYTGGKEREHENIPKNPP